MKRGALLYNITFFARGSWSARLFSAMLPAYAAVMVGVCLLACIVPTRRALAVEPTVVLRAD